MKTIEELLKNLARPEVLEFGLVTNRLPSVNIGGKFEPVDDEAPSTERLMQMLVTMGGSRYVDALTDKPVQWTTRLDGVGVIAVAAIMRKEVVQARFTVARREAASAAASRSPAVTSTQQSAGTPARDKASANQPAAAAAAAAASAATTQQRPPAQLVRTQESRTGAVPAPTPSPQPVATKAQPASGAQPQAQPASTGQTRAAGPQQTTTSTMPAVVVKQTAQIQPQVIKNVVSGVGGTGGQHQQQQHQQQPPVARPAAGTPPGAAAAAAAQAPAVTTPPAEEEWDDDDEPTLQTLSPPVTAPPTSGGEPRAKPARRPEEVSRPDAEEANAVAIRAAQEARAAAQERAAQERAAQERAAQERAAAEQRAAQERAAQERAAQERATQERVAQERAAQERAAQERAAKERTAQEQRAAQERAARERAAAQDAQRKAAGPQGPGRRINTPTSVDAVDVEITTNDAGSGKQARPVKIDIDLDADGADSTLNVPGAGDAAKAATAAAGGAGTPASARGGAAAGAVPTTTANIPEKDRPRVESSAALDSFLAMAIAARASDLHVVAGRPILLRVATDLLPRTQPVPSEHVERIAKEIVPTRLRDTLEKEGSCDFAVEHTTHGRFRVNVSRQRTGYKIALRVVPREVGTFAALGLPDVLANHLRHQRGLILITGPASHGKSTTLAALVDHLSRESARHIISIEEPIEHVHPRKKSLVSQREVGLHARTKSRAINAALREDCDTLVIGEMRDKESVRLALVACESGRLVLATMNMPSAAKTIDRIRDLFSPAEEPWVRSSLAASLRLIIGQRLVPSADRTRLHVAVELLPWSVALYGLIREGRTHQLATLQQRGKPLGIVRLDESLADLARAQKVTVEVAKQFAESPADLESQAVRPTGTNVGAAAMRKG